MINRSAVVYCSLKYTEFSKCFQYEFMPLMILIPIYCVRMSIHKDI